MIYKREHKDMLSESLYYWLWAGVFLNSWAKKTQNSTNKIYEWNTSLACGTV